MRKRTSLRRWKARCRIGRRISLEAIVNYELTRWFAFVSEGPGEYYVMAEES
jgi:hypothetical protein